MMSKNPSSETIGDVGSIAFRSDTFTQIARRIDGAGIVDTSRFIEAGNIAGAGLVDALRETVAVGGAGRSLAHHLRDDSGRAGGLHLVRDVAVAGPVAIVALHQARVAHSVVGSRRSHAPARFLDDDGEDEAVVDLRLERDLLDGVVDGADFGAGIVGAPVLIAARAEHDLLVVVEPISRKKIESFQYKHNVSLPLSLFLYYLLRLRGAN